MAFARRCDIALLFVYFLNSIHGRQVGIGHGQGSPAATRNLCSQSDSNSCEPYSTKQQAALARLLLVIHPGSVVAISPFVGVRNARSSRSEMGIMDNIRKGLDTIADVRDTVFGESPEISESEPGIVPKINFAPEQALPDSFDDAISIALNACFGAAQDGYGRIRVDFELETSGDETVPRIDGNKFLDAFLIPFANALVPREDNASSASEDKPLPRVQLVFGDEGQAAWAKSRSNLPTGTICSSLTPRLRLIEGVELVVFVVPIAQNIDDMKRFVAEVESQAPATTMLMINPRLQGDVFVRGMDQRRDAAQFEDSFYSAFALLNCATQTGPEEMKLGVLYRVHPEGWSAWLDDAESSEYKLIYSGPDRPDASILDSGASPDNLLAAFVNDMQRF